MTLARLLYPSAFFAIISQRITQNIRTMYQTNDPMTFERLPEAVSKLMKDVGEMKSMLQTIADRDTQPEKKWMSVDDLIIYLPGKPARQTIYSWVWKKAIPYHKAGAKLQFLKSEIDAWILGETFPVDDDEIVRVPVKARPAKKGGR